jgi:hypothetical protein
VVLAMHVRMVERRCHFVHRRLAGSIQSPRDGVRPQARRAPAIGE